MAKCYDHLGNEYKSSVKRAMAWNIPIKVFEDRIKRGWSLKDALTISLGERNASCKPCKDHLGNDFTSFNSMCKFYKIKKTTVNERLKRGWPLEKALTQPLNNTNKYKSIYDHKGNKYNNVKEMCDAYGISVNTYKSRRYSYKWSLEKTLTTSSIQSFKDSPTKDHLGNKFNTCKEMCEFYDINVETYKNRLYYKNWTLEKTLTTPLYIYDHKGNKYKTKKEMCENYNIDASTYNSRINKGLSIETALTIPKQRIKIEKIYGTYLRTHNGKHYYTCRCEDWDAKKILTLEQIKEESENG